MIQLLSLTVFSVAMPPSASFAELAAQRGDYASAWRHAVVTAHALNLSDSLDPVYMQTLGNYCSRAPKP